VDEAVTEFMVLHRRVHSGIALSYFRNGFAADLDAAVDVHDEWFRIGFTAQETSELVAFLGSL
jgi:hypothetical protein